MQEGLLWVTKQIEIEIQEFKLMVPSILLMRSQFFKEKQWKILLDTLKLGYKLSEISLMSLDELIRFNLMN